jgi:phosphatidylglycerophosphatase A
MPGVGEEKVPPAWADRVAMAVATGFGSGYVPVAPGTAGTAVAIPLWLAVSRFEPWVQVVTTAAYSALAVWAAGRAAARFGHHDDQHIVSDEIAGYLGTMLLVPSSWTAVAAGFVLFRLFDVVKPWPASFFDRRVENAWGNVFDDLAAALYARACMALGLWLAARYGVPLR